MKNYIHFCAHHTIFIGAKTALKKVLEKKNKKKHATPFMISDFCREIDENCTLLGYYTKGNGSY
jgi:hypothetical protein